MKIEDVIEEVKQTISILEETEKQGEYGVDLPMQIESEKIKLAALEKQLNGGWIPVSERLPNNCGLGVLLTIENKFQQRKVIQGFTGYMEKGKLEFHTNDKTTNLEIWKVIAWMPLPPAYKEVENERIYNRNDIRSSNSLSNPMCLRNMGLV